MIELNGTVTTSNTDLVLQADTDKDVNITGDNIKLTINATNVMPLPNFSIPMDWVTKIGGQGANYTQISIDNILKGNVILKAPSSATGDLQFYLPYAAAFYDILDVGQSLSCLFSVDSFSFGAKLKHQAATVVGPGDESTNGRYNFFGWDTATTTTQTGQTVYSGVQHSYKEPPVNAEYNAPRIQMVLKIARTQRLYFTNLGIVTEKKNLFSSAGLKKIRVTWEGDGVYGINN